MQHYGTTGLKTFKTRQGGLCLRVCQAQALPAPLIGGHGKKISAFNLSQCETRNLTFSPRQQCSQLLKPQKSLQRRDEIAIASLINIGLPTDYMLLNTENKTSMEIAVL